MSEQKRPERPWATGVLVVSGLISLSFNVRHSLSTSLPGPLALLYGAGPVALAAAQSHVVALQAARGELIGGWRKAFTFGLVIGALALSFLGVYDLLQHTVPNPFHGFPVNVPAVLTPIVIDLMAIAALNELLRSPNPVRVSGGHDAAGATNGRGHLGATTGPRQSNSAGATTGANGQRVAKVAPRPEVTPALPVAPTVARPSTPVTPAAEPSNLVEFTPRGHAQEAMRAHWDERIAAGVIPSGADLNRTADKDPKYSLGKKYAKQWRESLPDEFVEAVEAGRTEEAREIAAGFSAGEWKEAAR